MGDTEATPRRDVGITGIDSVLYKPGVDFWLGEQPPTIDLVKSIDHLNARIRADILMASDTKWVDEMAGMRLEPSQEMRLWYFKAYLLRELYDRDFRQAYAVFGHALDIAFNHDDLDSQLVLTDQLALMKFGRGQNYDALIHYQVALEIWQERASQLANLSAEPEAHFRERIGMMQFYIGDFDAAAGSLAWVLTIYNQRPDIPRSLYLQTTAAQAMWTLGLAHRAQSDMQDGSESLLMSAIERMNQAIEIYRQVGRHEYDVGRLHIQLAETRLDLSDFYLQNQQDKPAGDAREQAMRNIIAAKDVQYFSDADDPSGRPLAELARLRHKITRLPDDEAIGEVDDFDTRLRMIERKAAADSHHVTIAKAAALRGEWLLWLGDVERARESFVFALAGFSAASMGEATRVQRLLRRSNDETRLQRVRHTRATGARVSRPRKRP